MLLTLLTLVACKDPSSDGDPHDSTPVDTDTATDTDSATDTDTGVDGAAWCAENDFGMYVPWDAAGPYGTLRHQTADDFTVPLADGTEWHFADEWKGCESYVFVPDSITRDETDDRPVFTKDIDELIAGSPRNAHYFFASVSAGSGAQENIDDAQDKLENALADLSAEDADWWRAHIHVIANPVGRLDGWVPDVFRGIGQAGFAIDRFQQLRGVGYFADVTRYDPSLSWPWKNNLAYAAHEARFFNMEAGRAVEMAEFNTTVVPLFTGEVVSQYADVEVELPSASEMAEFDTFQIEIDMRCPDPDAIEFGNCGAWDYIANLFVEEDDGTWTELGRFITTYHREAHWILDATPMMVHLLDGGTRNFRWSWAPEWNVQPTETRVNLHFSNHGKGYAPRNFTLLATGGGFGSTYNDNRVPIDIIVPAAAKKVELWAVISGHGSGTNQCAEFCNHQHEFTVNGHTHLQEYPMAQQDEGCIADIEQQMTPNQGGTWWFGRGGWCPGGIVHPYAVDVTSEVTAGEEATWSYRGLFDGATPPDGSGDIVLNAWVVEYE